MPKTIKLGERLHLGRDIAVLNRIIIAGGIRILGQRSQQYLLVAEVQRDVVKQLGINLSGSISGGTLGMLAAPTSGPMEGILVFQDRSITSSQTNTVSGGSTLSFEGALYFPTTPLNFSGNSSGSAAYTIIIAKTIDFSGLSNLRAGFGNLQNGNPIKKVALAD